MLKLNDIQVNYGLAPALWGISLEVADGELVSVIGPNGAGKTTLINAIMGLNRLKAGQILWDGQVISSLPAHRLCEQGLALVPESRRLFAGMSVRDLSKLRGAGHPRVVAGVAAVGHVGILRGVRHGGAKRDRFAGRPSKTSPPITGPTASR
jgi:branched-chain amino acid transport system ATP-binding protein